MIFLRQKQFSTSTRNTNNHRSRTRAHNQRYVQHQQITRQNAIDLGLVRNRNNRNHGSRSQQTRDDVIVRSVLLNEKLASIGGLFGAVNIMVTGALLYSVFTAKPEQRWWYLIGVIVNISLLILLMICAILFDRFYLKRFTSRAAPSSQSLTNNRIINTNPTLLQNTQDFLSYSNSNDVPPQYPDCLDESNSIKIENELSPILRLNNSIDTQLINNSSFNSSEFTQGHSLNEIKQNQELNCSQLETDTVKYQLPPNYFDLYPKQTIKNSSEYNSCPSTSTTSTNSTLTTTIT